MRNRLPATVYLRFLYLIAGAGAFIILYSISRYGPAISNDSAQYLSIAQTLTERGAFESYLPGPITKWPPLYPILLAIMSKVLGIDPLQVAGYLSALSFSLLIAGSGYLAAVMLGYPYYLATLATTLVFMSRFLIATFVFAWTEPLFIVLSLLFLISLHAYLINSQAKWMALMITSVALACLTRYLGITLIFAGAASLLLLRRSPFRRRIAAGALFAFGSSLPLGLWLARNYLIAGNLAGNRTTVTDIFIENLRLLAKTLSRWYGPTGLTFLLVVIAVASGIIVGLLFNMRSKSSIAPRPEIGILILFIFSYLAGLLIVTSSIALTPIDDRYMSPIFVPTLILILYIAKQITLSTDRRKVRVVGSTIVFIWGFALLISSVEPVFSDTKFRARNGAGGLNLNYWRASSTAAFLRENPELAETTIYTNAPDAVYVLTGFSARYLPSKDADPELAKNQLNELSGQWPSEESVLLWFNYTDRSWMFTEKELLNIVEVNEETTFNDGALYAISKRNIHVYERSFDAPQPDVTTDIRWGEKITLLGYEPLDNADDVEILSIEVFWQALTEIERSYTVFFHVLDPNTEELVAQSDVIPRGWSYPTNQWAVGEVVDDIVQVQLTDLPPGDYDLYIGWYDSDTGERLSVKTGEPREIIDNRILLTTIKK